MPIINMVYKKKKGGVNPYDLLSDVIVYYPMQGDMKDIGPNGWDLSTVAGSYTGGTNYNTLSSYNGRNSSATYSTSASATISCWGNITSGNTLVLGSDGASGWGFAGSVSVSVSAVINNAAYKTADISASSGFHMYTGVFDYVGRTLKFYVDGELKQTNSSLPSSGGLRGGRWIQLGSASGGTIGNTTGQYGITFATQNAMSQADIQAFYNASKNLYQ